MVLRRPALKPARRPLCSVCIANYNGRETLDACLRSVLAQDCAFEVEIIVHDDASPDRSAERLQERYHEVELLLGGENAGFCVSNNRMVDIARGDYILLLNNDAELFPDALRKLHERASVVPDAILGLPQYALPEGHLLDRGSLVDPFLNPLPNLDPARREVAMVMGACLWIPRKLWRDIGGFPPWFHTNAEDLYLCTIARLWGFRVEVLPDSGFRHRVGQSLGGGKLVRQRMETTVRRRALSERNKTFTIAITYPGVILAPMLPVHLLALVVEGLFMAIAGCDASLWRRIYWHCLKELAREARTIIAARGAVQQRRSATLRQFLAPYSWLPWKLRMLLRHGVPRIAG